MSDVYFEQIELLFAKLHPLTVHFPIGLLVAAGLIELVHRLRSIDRPHKHTRLLLLIGAFAATLASANGLANLDSQQFFGSLSRVVFIHQWVGITLSVGALLLAWWLVRCEHSLNGRRLDLFRGSLIALSSLVIAVAHYGGKIVHGEDYYAAVFNPQNHQLTASDSEIDQLRARFNPKFLATRISHLPPASSQTVQYERDILPIFEETCRKCHLDGKRKGEYSLDSRELALQGGKSGVPAIVPGDSAHSPLVHLLVGIDEENIMPNKGRLLTSEEVSLVRAWIDQGAPWRPSENVDDGRAAQQTDAKITTDSYEQIEKKPTLPKSVSLPRADPNDPMANPIDLLLSSYFKDRKIEAPETVSDRIFARRLYLDLLGVLPSSEELNQFVIDNTTDKRAHLVDQLLSERVRYAAHWLTFWNDALRNGYTGPGFLHGKRKEITYWLYRALKNNLPYDQFVQELVNPQPSTAGFTRGILWWKNPEEVNPNEHPAMQAAQNIGQVFMGVNIKCASCHDSFTDGWTLQDAYGLANIYSLSPLQVHECNQPTGEWIAPRALYPEVGELSSPLTDNLQSSLAEIHSIRKPLRRGRKRKALLHAARHERTEAFSRLLTDPKNRRFARTLVNRLWAKLFGQGIVSTLDELDHPAWSPELLEWLADDFVQNGYDIQHTMRLILTSQAYQAKASAIAAHDQTHDFRGPIPKRLTVEQVLDSIHIQFDLPQSISADEAERVVRIAKQSSTQRVAGLRGSARLWSVSDPITQKNPVIDLSAKIENAKTLWIAVIPKHRVVSRIEELAERHAQIQRAEQEFQSNLKDSLSKEETDLGEDSDGKERAGSLSSEEPYITIAFGTLHGNGGTRSLADLEPIDSESLRELSGRREVNLLGEVVEDGIPVRPLALMRYDLKAHPAEKLTARIGFEQIPESDEFRYEVVTFSDFEVRRAFLENTPFQWTMGRPRREQVTTSRSGEATTLQGIALAKNKDYLDLLNRATEKILRDPASKGDELIRSLYQRLLGREPSEEEMNSIKQSFEGEASPSKVQDLLWAISALPEFQFVL